MIRVRFRLSSAAFLLGAVVTLAVNPFGAHAADSLYEGLADLDVDVVERTVEAIPTDGSLTNSDQRKLADDFLRLAIEHGSDRRASMDEIEQWLILHGDSVPTAIFRLARQATDTEIDSEPTLSLLVAALSDSWLPNPEIDLGLQRIAKTARSHATSLQAARGLLNRYEILNATTTDRPPTQTVDLVVTGPGVDNQFAYQRNPEIARATLRGHLEQTDSDWAVLEAAEVAIDANLLDLPLAAPLSRIAGPQASTEMTLLLQRRAQRLLLDLDEKLFLAFLADPENQVNPKWIADTLESFLNRGSRNPLLLPPVDLVLLATPTSMSLRVRLEKLRSALQIRIDLDQMQNPALPIKRTIPIAERLQFTHGNDRPLMKIVSQAAAGWIRDSSHATPEERARALRLLLTIEGESLGPDRLRSLGFEDGKIPADVLIAAASEAASSKRRAACETLFEN